MPQLLLIHTGTKYLVHTQWLVILIVVQQPTASGFIQNGRCCCQSVIVAFCGKKGLCETRPRLYLRRTTVSGVFHPVKRQPNMTKSTTPKKDASSGLPALELSAVVLPLLSDMLADMLLCSTLFTSSLCYPASAWSPSVRIATSRQQLGEGTYVGYSSLAVALPGGELGGVNEPYKRAVSGENGQKNIIIFMISFR